MNQAIDLNDPDGTIKHFAAGTVLFREGDCGECAYIIEAGIVEISTCVRNDRLVLQMAGPGEIVGEMAIIDDDARSATATVVVDSKLRIVHRRQLQERMRKADPILHMLMRLVTKRYRRSVASLKDGNSVQDARVDAESEDLTDAAFDKFRMEGQLRSAIENRGLAVLYQPIADLRSRRVLGFEALVRWKYPHLGFVSPQVFVSLAEETNLIRAVDELVFKEAVEGIRRINCRIGGDKNSFISVNVSARQLEDADYLEMARASAQGVGVAPELIKLELTESQIARNEHAESWVETARAQGFGVSLDDFGAGFSSLSQLLRLNVDTVKIDQSFIQNLGRMERSGEMLRGIIALAKSMKLSIVAEGIETEAQQSELLQADCTLGQGFLLGTPMSLEEILTKATFTSEGVYFAGAGDLLSARTG